MRYLLYGWAFFFVLSLSAQPLESDYRDALSHYLNGEIEVPVTDGKVDIVTQQYAIEVEFANKWKESIGQAIWYGLQTNREPAIILIRRASDRHNYPVELESALRHAGLNDRIRVWVYPQDFPGVTVSEKEAVANPNPIETPYWLNLNGNKRHKSTCQYYGKTKRGRYCKASEGVAAGCCH